MPVTVEYLQDHEGQKKGERVRMLAPTFIRLRRQGIVKRIASEQPNIIRPATAVKKQTAKPARKVSTNSMKNLLKGKQKK